MKNNKPKTSKVGFFDFTIVYEENPTIPITGERCFGYCDDETTTLIIDKNLTEEQTKFYLAHEIFEQINALYFLELTHPQIGALGVYFLEYIRNNPDVIEYLRRK